MAHSTGYFIIRQYEADIKTDEYCVLFGKEIHYYYEPMSDSNEPTWEWTGKYNVSVGKWYTRKNGQVEMDECWSDCDVQNAYNISKDEANKIWWNIKHRKPDFETIKRYIVNLNATKGRP